MPIELTIREATNEDAEAIRQINLCAWDGNVTHQMLEERHGLLNGKPWAEQIADSVAANLGRDDVTVFVAEHEGRVVGYASAQISSAVPHDVGTVGYNAVEPESRRRGVGTALMRRVRDHLKDHGARTLVVWTLEKSEAARRMYEGLGFRELTRMIHYRMDC